MSEENMLQERLQLFKDAAQLKPTNRIPNVSNFYTWKILDSDSNYKLSEAMNDWDTMEKIVCEFADRYQFDAYLDLGTRNPIKITGALGTHFHEVDDEKESVNYYDHILMKGDEYEELNKNPLEFFWTKCMPRKFDNITVERMKNAMFEFMSYGQYNGKMIEMFVTKYQAPQLFNASTVMLHPYEMLFSNLRGIKEISLDLRKHKSKMLETLEILYQMNIQPLLDNLLASDTSAYACDTYTAFLGHSILSTKQFGEIYWPKLKKIIDVLAENGKTMYIFCESEMLRFYEYFQEVPKGCLVIHLEQDNIFEFRKKLPNICVSGGMTTDLLGTGTPQQCVDFAKKLVDELGRDGGYIFSQNKMMSFRNDCKRENLLAVNDFIRNYRV
ncbi:MAG: uroporphyrinogen decarboxylase family protein [Eubacteriaceae bacterium]